MNINVAFYNELQIFRFEFEHGSFEQLRKSALDARFCQFIIKCNLMKFFYGA